MNKFKLTFLLAAIFGIASNILSMEDWGFKEEDSTIRSSNNQDIPFGVAAQALGIKDSDLGEEDDDSDEDVGVFWHDDSKHEEKEAQFEQNRIAKVLEEFGTWNVTGLSREEAFGIQEENARKKLEKQLKKRARIQTANRADEDESGSGEEAEWSPSEVNTSPSGESLKELRQEKLNKACEIVRLMEEIAVKEDEINAHRAEEGSLPNKINKPEADAREDKGKEKIQDQSAGQDEANKAHRGEKSLSDEELKERTRREIEFNEQWGFYQEYKKEQAKSECVRSEKKKDKFFDATDKLEDITVPANNEDEEAGSLITERKRLAREAKGKEKIQQDDQANLPIVDNVGNQAQGIVIPVVPGAGENNNNNQNIIDQVQTAQGNNLGAPDNAGQNNAGQNGGADAQGQGQAPVVPPVIDNAGQPADPRPEANKHLNIDNETRPDFLDNGQSNEPIEVIPPAPQGSGLFGTIASMFGYSNSDTSADNNLEAGEPQSTFAGKHKGKILGGIAALATVAVAGIAYNMSKEDDSKINDESGDKLDEDDEDDLINYLNQIIDPLNNEIKDQKKNQNSGNDNDQNAADDNTKVIDYKDKYANCKFFIIPLNELINMLKLNPVQEIQLIKSLDDSKKGGIIDLEFKAFNAKLIELNHGKELESHEDAYKLAKVVLAKFVEYYEALQNEELQQEND